MAPMNETTHTSGRSRRLVGLERRYDCERCGAEHLSWSRIRACPDCGEPLAVAVIRRAAVVGA